MKQLIINTEFFLQCYGHCAGCFLSENERNSNNTYINEVTEGLEILHQKYKEIKIEHLVIGFGRGNILNLAKQELDQLLILMKWCEENFSFVKLTFEVSTSLIGKLDKQIESALYLLSENKHIFFNIVINSEITSLQFWKNLQSFYEATSSYRKNEWYWEEDWGDIIVLNINPRKLPDLNFIEEFTKDYYSPINISIFPFEKNEKITKEELENVQAWSGEAWNRLHMKDLNIKNYLEGLNSVDIEGFNQIKEFQSVTEKSYYFIDKHTTITNGSLSIMGEVDKIRLLEKYDLNLDIYAGYKLMQKNKICAVCDYQKECLLSGAYLNLMANTQRTQENNVCLSGYQKLFKLAKIE